MTILTLEEQAREVQRIAGLARPGAQLWRCDGTLEELDRYRHDDDDKGWQCAGPGRKGDLLLSTVGTGANRMIVSLCRVDQYRDYYVWDASEDVSIRPAALWADVMRRAQLAGPAWNSQSGSSVSAVVDALAECVEEQVDTPEIEGERLLQRCRQRSPLNRRKALERANGRCAGCGVNLLDRFGWRGRFGLEVHHKTPLSEQPEGKIETHLKDLVVLCATCHRLIHADPKMKLWRLSAGWRGRL